MRPLPKLLSKTKLMRGYRCLKSIYYTIHRPDLEPEVTAAQQQVFDQGNEVGELARTYYPGGVLVDAKPWEFGLALKRTKELLALETEHIYEAAFEYKGCFARVDVLKYNKDTQRWTLLEVKSSTKVKDEHIEDVGLQAWIIANSGIKLERIALVHLNSECRYPDLSNLFVEVDITDRLREQHTEITPRLNSIFQALRSKTPPDVVLGPHCSKNRRDCEFKIVCWNENAIPQMSIFNLPGFHTKVWSYFYKKQIELSALEDDPELNELQRRIVQVHKTGKRFVDAEKIREAVEAWRYPLVYLDFETIGPAIPRFPGCTPYNQVPFQFSVHIEDAPGAELRHEFYLHDLGDDPRPALIPRLLKACAGNGSIVAYHAKFEGGRIEEMANCFPEHADGLNALLPRLVDPLPLMRENVYDVGFQGHFGLKWVAPSLLGKGFSYEGMNVADGTAAQRAYMELVKFDDEERKQRLRADMLAYCEKDTLAMVRCVEWLRLNSR